MALQEQSWGAVFQDWGSRALDAAVNLKVNYPYGVQMNQAALMQQYNPMAGYYQQGVPGVSSQPLGSGVAGIPTQTLLIGAAALVAVLLLVR